MFRIRFVLLLLIASGFAAPAAADPTSALPTGSASVGAFWTRLGAPAGIDRAEALALDASGARLAVGGERGVALGPISGPLDRVLARGPVRDLVFLPDGALLAGTDAGLYRFASGRVLAETIAPGEAARDVRDLDVGEDLVAAATAAGVYVTSAAAHPRWRRVSGFPFGEATRVALLREPTGRVSLWAVIGGALWTAPLEGQGERIALARAARGEEGVVALARGADGALLAVSPQSIAVRDASGDWRSERLVLPPGATPRRVSAEPGRLWLATDAGLLIASGPAGPWRRAGPPAGHVSVSAVAGEGARLVVATAHGLLRHAGGASAVAEAVPTAPVVPTPRTDPPIVLVQRRALRYLALEPHHMLGLWRAAGRRGLFPELSLRGDYGRDRDVARDYDQSFLSGATRHLHDRDRNRGEDYGVAVELSWDLGDAVFQPDRIDISREARLVAQLRDDVLDEINQLYFERQRVLASLATPPPDTTAAALLLRAEELASGLDAWTGGWFSAQRTRGPDSPAKESLP